MHNLDLILTLAGGLIAALALGLITNRLGLSPIVGYLVAGIFVGPHTPGFSANQGLADQLAEVGVILLMFGVGLQFHFKELLAVKRIAVPGAVVQSLVATALGAGVAHLFGWTWSAGIIFGLAISVASTVVLMRVLVDHHELHTPTGHIAVGWLVVEDIFTVFVLVVMPAVFGGGADAEGAGRGLWLSIGAAILKIGALVAFTFLVGGWVIPRLLGYIAKTGSRELFTLGVLVVALGIAVGSATLFGVSMALGAFLAGMVVGRSEFSLRAATDALPMRDAFAVLFFVSVGMLVDFRVLVQSPGLVLATLAIVLIGKPAAALGLVMVMKYPFRVALSVAVALAQIGEFSFILATMGRQLHVLPDEASNIIVAAAILSITVNPLIYGLVDPVEAWVRRRPSLARLLRSQEPAEAKAAPTANRPDRHRAVVVGYGPVGQTLARLMRENEIEPTIVEMNLETVQRLRREGWSAVYGDASHPETLKEAGVGDARVLILSSSSMRAGRELVREARQINPRLRVLARTAYLREQPELRSAGADEVFAGEGEVALSMTEYVLREFGATAEQIERESGRIRDELFDQPAGSPGSGTSPQSP